VLACRICSGRVPLAEGAAGYRKRLDRGIQAVRDGIGTMRNLGPIGVCAIILLGGIASAGAKGGGSGSGNRAVGHAGQATQAALGGHQAIGPPAGLVYDHTAPPGTFCPPGVCLKSAP
jgi:hypothetical protein